MKESINEYNILIASAAGKELKNLCPYFYRVPAPFRFRNCLRYSIQHAGTTNKHSIQTALFQSGFTARTKMKVLRQTEDLRKEDIMITILTEEKSELLKKFIGEDIYRRVSENRNFFTVLSEKQYLLTFHWLDGRKVTVFASPENLIIVSGSPSVSEFAQNIDTPSDGILQFHEFLLEMTANDVYKLESLENMIISLEDRLLMDTSPSKNGIGDIIKVRKDLLKVKRYYEQMEFLSDELLCGRSSLCFHRQEIRPSF